MLVNAQRLIKYLMLTAIYFDFGFNANALNKEQLFSVYGKEILFCAAACGCILILFAV